MKILIVEDETRTGDYLRQGLREAGFAAEVARDGVDGLHLLLAEPFDLAIVDVMLPRLDGWALVKTLREAGLQLPVLFLTARDEVEDRVRGLELGADDYLVKPFAFTELLARVRTLLRRRNPVAESTSLKVADLELDLARRRAVRAGQRIDLTGKEFALLELLARNVRRVVSRADIVAHVWDDNHDPFTNAVEVYMNRLRGKIDRDSDTPVLHTRRGVGYILTDDPPG